MPSERSMPSEITGEKAERTNAKSISLQTCIRPFWITVSVTGSRLDMAAMTSTAPASMRYDRCPIPHHVGSAARLAHSSRRQPSQVVSWLAHGAYDQPRSGLSSGGVAVTSTYFPSQPCTADTGTLSGPQL